MGRRILGQRKLIDASLTPYTVDPDEDSLLMVDATGSNIVINFPAAATWVDRDLIAIKKIDTSANTISLTPNGAEQIDRGGAGVAHVLSVQNQSRRVFSNGTELFII